VLERDVSHRQEHFAANERELKPKAKAIWPLISADSR
jgi:hypothetical protein